MAKKRKWGGVRVAGEGKKLGRPCRQGNAPGSRITVYLPAADIEYLALWSESKSAAVREIIDRAIKFWPQGV